MLLHYGHQALTGEERVLPPPRRQSNIRHKDFRSSVRPLSFAPLRMKTTQLSEVAIFSPPGLGGKSDFDMKKDEVNEVEDTNDDNECFLRFSDKAENQSHNTFLHLFHLLDTILPRMVFCGQAS